MAIPAGFALVPIYPAAPIDIALKAIASQVGADSIPSKSAVVRVWKRLDVPVKEGGQ